MPFSFHAATFTIAGMNYNTPAIELTDEQARHLIAYAVRVRIERAAAGKADDSDAAHAAREKRIGTVFDIEASTRRSPVEAETVNLFHAWLRSKGEKAEAVKKATSVKAAAELAAAYLPDDPDKGESAVRVENLIKALTEKAESIVASRVLPDVEV